MRKTVTIDLCDCTGFDKIAQGRKNNGYNNPLVNAQRLANVALFKLAVAKGEHPEEVARSLKYSLQTLRNWMRFFDGPTTK